MEDRDFHLLEYLWNSEKAIRCFFHKFHKNVENIPPIAASNPLCHEQIGADQRPDIIERWKDRKITCHICREPSLCSSAQIRVSKWRGNGKIKGSLRAGKGARKDQKIIGNEVDIIGIIHLIFKDSLDNTVTPR